MDSVYISVTTEMKGYWFKFYFQKKKLPRRPASRRTEVLSMHSYIYIYTHTCIHWNNKPNLQARVSHWLQSWHSTDFHPEHWKSPSAINMGFYLVKDFSKVTASFVAYSRNTCHKCSPSPLFVHVVLAVLSTNTGLYGLVKLPEGKMSNTESK